MDDILAPRPKKPKVNPEPKSTVIKPATEPVATLTAETPVKQAPPLEATPDKPAKKERFYKRFHPIQWFKGLSKKQKVLTILVAIIILAGGSAGAWALFKPEPKAAPKPAVVEVPKEEPKKETEPSRLSGLQVKPELNKRPVTGIMIENSPDARPQSGLRDAGVVFEAIAEGGITRFLALFQEGQPDHIGPVRSVRPYYVDWVHGFDAAIAHVGGSSDGLAKIKSDGVKDLDQFANPKPFKRVSNRYAPHNMYTSMAGLDELSQSKGFTSSTFDSFPRKDDQPLAAPTAKTLNFNISGQIYNPQFDYDTATNSYKRSHSGKPHKDEKSGEQLAPKVVIAAVINYGIAPNGVNSKYDNLGSGKAYIFQDGFVTQATWNKPSGGEQITFKDDGGRPIKLNAGQTWISVVASADRVSYK